MSSNANTHAPAAPEACATIPPRARRPFVRAGQVRQALMVVAQGSGLWLLSELGFALTDRLGLALPGNLLGMMLLFVLLVSGIVRLEWVNDAATFLLRHLAFFFIPIAVGLMTMGELMRSHGIPILVALLASAAAGIVASGRVVQGLSRPATDETATKV